MDLVFILDSSGSINDRGSMNWQLILDFVNNVIANLEVSQWTTRVGLVRFSNDANVEFYLDSYYDKVAMLNRINSTSYIGGTTNIAEALQIARLNVFDPSRGDRLDVPNVVVLIADGQANERVNETQVNESWFE